MAIDKIESAGLATSTNQPGLRNIIINGDMSIAQRGHNQLMYQLVKVLQVL